jgi:hypothetical protein
MRVITWLATLIAAMALIAGAGVATNGRASASNRRTYAYACGMGSRRGCPTVRPGEIAFGALYDVTHVRWSSWGSGSAFGRGHFFGGRGGPSFNAYIALYDVKTRNGRRYFSWIKIAAPGHKTQRLQYSGGLWRTR